MPLLNLEYEGGTVACGIDKVDRSKLYGRTETEVLDERGRPCRPAMLANDGKTIIPRGGIALAYVSPAGFWRDKSDLRAIDLNGNPIEGVTSTFKETVALEETCTCEKLLDHNIRMVYRLEPAEDQAFPADLLDALGDGAIFTFPFSYRGGLTADTAFVLQADGAVWLLVGGQTDIHFIAREDPSGIAGTEEEEEDEESEDFDFGTL